MTTLEIAVATTLVCLVATVLLAFWVKEAIYLGAGLGLFTAFTWFDVFGIERAMSINGYSVMLSCMLGFVLLWLFIAMRRR